MLLRSITDILYGLRKLDFTAKSEVEEMDVIFSNSNILSRGEFKSWQ